MPHFGDLLRRHRLAAELSQEGLAERAGLSARGISALERGINRSPQRETILRLVDALALSGEERTAFLAAARRRALADEPPARPRAALPTPPTALVGRDQEMRTLVDLIRRSAVRLITLTGPGGVGKTRLALAVAEELNPAFPDGVLFVPLAGLSDPRSVMAVLAQSAGLHVAGNHPPATALAAHWEGKRILLVLDNFEHLLPAAPDLAAMLAACPTLTVLVTSRAALHLRGERETPVVPLAVPGTDEAQTPEELARYPAVSLFVARVQDQRAEFALNTANAGTVAAICTRLDGLPLALELAAGQSRLFSPRALLARLERRLAVLSGGPRDLPERQQSLRATLAWSYELLHPPEQALFRRLAVFAGGCSLEAVEALCAATSGLGGDVLDALRGLVYKTMVQQSETAEGEPRFAMLETVREYALERLALAGELAPARRTHAGWCLALAEDAQQALRGPDQAAWLARLEREHDNFRAALQWSIREDGDHALGLELAGYLGSFWEKRGYFGEGRAWLEQALALRPAVEDVVRARALNLAGNLAYAQGDNERAQVLYEEALTVRRAVGDQARIASALMNVGNVAFAQGDLDRALRLYAESLAIQEALGDTWGRAFTLNNMGVVVRRKGDHARAWSLYQECGELWRALGDNWRVAVALANQASALTALGEAARARALYGESLAMRRDLGDRQGLVLSLYNLGHLAHQQGEDERAARLLAAARAFGAPLGVGPAPHEQPDHERIVRELRERLGEAAFDAAWTAGQGLSYEQAVAYALDRTGVTKGVERDP